MTRDLPTVPTLALALLLAGCQQTPSLVERDGYYTWVDEQGQVRTTRVPASQGDSEPVLRSEREGGGSGTKTGVQAPESAQPQVQALTEDQARAPAQPQARSGANSENSTPLAPAEPAAREAGGDGEYNLDNYPDAEALEAAGYVRPGEPLPYFTWRDANGQLQVSYYRPDTRSDVARGLVPEPISLSPARVYQAGAPASDSATRGEASEAFRVLGIEAGGPDAFGRWQQGCCRSLPVADVVAWADTREFQVSVPAGTPVHAFPSGTSPYRLVRLPPASETPNLVLRLRAFHDDGLFLPSAAFLDANLEPLRLVTELVMAYTPESWHRQGYLEAMLPAFPGRGERWLLLYTTEADLQGQTVIETDRGPKAIRHRSEGLLSITEMGG